MWTVREYIGPVTFICCDLGQVNDPTAVIALVRDGEGEQSVCHIPQIERYPLGVSYVQVVNDLAAKMSRAPLSARLILDGTGVGRAIVDQFLNHPNLKTRRHLYPVTCTAGDNESFDGLYWRVPKKNLVGATQVLLQSGRLKIKEDLPLTPVLVKELQDFKVKITTAANVVFGEWREGHNDDLCFAVALGCWAATHKRVGGAGVKVSPFRI